MCVYWTVNIKKLTLIQSIKRNIFIMSFRQYFQLFHALTQFLCNRYAILCLQPEKFVNLGIEPPKGVLLFGPPGTGKTLCARAVANRTDACFIRVIGSELVQKYVGEVGTFSTRKLHVDVCLRSRGWLGFSLNLKLYVCIWGRSIKNCRTISRKIPKRRQSWRNIFSFQSNVLISK